MKYPKCKYSKKYYLQYIKLTIFSFQFAQKRRKKTLIALLLFAHKKTNMLACAEQNTIGSNKF